MKLRISPKYKWMAMDEDKLWFLYANKPSMILDGWDVQAGGIVNIESMKIPPVKDWRKSLHRRRGDEWIKVKQ